MRNNSNTVDVVAFSVDSYTVQLSAATVSDNS